MTEMQDYEILERAATSMQTKGWNSGSRHGYNGTVCVLGALEDALGVKNTYLYHTDRSVDQHPILKLLVKEIGLKDEDNKCPAYALANWSNNADGETVIGWLRKIAQRLRDAVTI